MDTQLELLRGKMNIRISNRSFLLLSFLVGIIISFAACAKTEGVKPINTTAENVAIKGFDTVAYFKDKLPKEGKAEFSHEWNGAKWYFSSAENRDEFAKTPEKYAPQFGGYCSWAVSHGYTADSDPQAWKVVDGKLYLNYNQKVKEKWEAEQPKLIQEGEKNWTEFKVKKPEHKG